MAACGTDKNVRKETIYAGKFRERFPNISPAGLCTEPPHEENVPRCLQFPERPPTPDQISKIRNWMNPYLEKRRVHFGKLGDIQTRHAQHIVHGVDTQSSKQTSGQLLNPPVLTRMQKAMLDREEKVYHSTNVAPLSKSHSYDLPKHVDPLRFTFGMASEKGGLCGKIVNPPKSFTTVENESEEGHKLYVASHQDYWPGEQVSRSYPYQHFRKCAVFGEPSPHDATGRRTKQCMDWIYSSQLHKGNHTVGLNEEKWKEKYQPQLGKGLDPLKETRRVGEDHVYGYQYDTDPYGVSDLMHYRSPENYQNRCDDMRGLVASVRHHLKTMNYLQWDGLLNAFRHYDRSGSGKLNFADLKAACQQFKLPVDERTLLHVFEYCDINKDQFIDFQEFANFLNWTLPLPPNKYAEYTEARILPKSIDPVPPDHYNTSSLEYGLAADVSTDACRRHGLPSARIDLPCPKEKRVHDKTDYGDQPSMNAVMHPSVYSLKGVYEEDMLKPRTREEIREVMANVGIVIPMESFEVIWERAKAKSHRQEVSVESFRQVLDEIEVQKALSGISEYSIRPDGATIPDSGNFPPGYEGTGDTQTAPAQTQDKPKEKPMVLS